MKKEIGNIKFLLVVIFCILIFFQDIIQQYISIFKNFDELLPIMLIFFTLIKLILQHGKINYNFRIKNVLKIITLMIVLLVIGILSNKVHIMQPNKAILGDIVIVFKGFITYCIAVLLFNNVSFDNKRKCLLKILSLISYIFMLITIVSFIFKIFPDYNDLRGITLFGEVFHIPVQKLMFSHPTYLASFGIGVILLLLYLSKDNENTIWPVTAMTFVVLTTQRSKAIGFLIIYFISYFLIIKKHKKVSIKKIAVLGFISAFIFRNKIMGYLTNSDWARTALMSNSIKVANDFFPLGGGFATFGTFMSGVYYSPLYYIYGISNIYGLMYKDYSFISDTYWPAIIGQFGYIGLLITISIIYYMYKNIEKKDGDNKYFARISALIYMLILTTSESAFMSPVAIIFMIIIAI